MEAKNANLKPKLKTQLTHACDIMFFFVSYKDHDAI